MDSPKSSRRGSRDDKPNYKRHGSRYKARRRAVDILFEAEARDVDPVAICDERSSMACDPESDVRPVNAYTRAIVEGVAVELNTIDGTIVDYLTEDWELDRIAATDRAILRVIVWEMLFSPDVPAKVAVVEATELASQYSDHSSPAYINAMLDRMSREVDALKKQIADSRRVIEDTNPAAHTDEVARDPETPGATDAPAAGGAGNDEQPADSHGDAETQTDAAGTQTADEDTTGGKAEEAEPENPETTDSGATTGPESSDGGAVETTPEAPEKETEGTRIANWTI